MCIRVKCGLVIVYDTDVTARALPVLKAFDCVSCQVKLRNSCAHEEKSCRVTKLAKMNLIYTVCDPQD